MDKETLEKKLMEVDVKTAEVMEVLGKMAAENSPREKSSFGRSPFGIDDMASMMQTMTSQLTDPALLHTVTAAITVAAKTQVIAEYMGVDPKMIQKFNRQ